MSEMNVLFFQQIVKMFLMLAIGFAAVKVKILPAAAGKGLSQVIVAVIRPCAILYAFQVDFSTDRLLGLLLALLGPPCPTGRSSSSPASSAGGGWPSPRWSGPP